MDRQRQMAQTHQKMKEIYCKSCGKRFAVSDTKVSEAERTGLCGDCKDHIRIEA